MPDVSLTTDKLNIYPDGVYRLSAVVADPEQYEGTINYQWQKYSTAKRTWTDVDGCKNKTIASSSVPRMMPEPTGAVSI